MREPISSKRAAVSGCSKGVLCIALLLAVVTHAGSPKAAALAKEADRLYNDGKYREAADRLQKAYDIDQTPVLMFNMARALDQAGDLSSALAAYRQYISLPDADSQLAKRANLAIDRLKGLLAKSETERQRTEAESRRLKEEADNARKKADAEAQRARRQKEEFEAQEAARRRAQNTKVNLRRIAGIVAGGLALGAVGAGIAFGVGASNTRAAFMKATTLDAKRTYQSDTQQRALVADISFVAAIAFGVTFGIVFPWNPNVGSSEVRIALSPQGISIGGCF